MGYIGLESFPKSARVELSWAQIPKGQTASSYDIKNMSEQSSAMVGIYSDKMSCVREHVETKNNSKGRHSPVYERIDYPGNICQDCPIIANCYIRLLSKHEDNIKALPDELQSFTYYY